MALSQSSLANCTLNGICIAKPQRQAGSVEYRGPINAALLSRTEEILARTIFERLDAGITKCQLAKSPLVKPASLISSAQKTYDEFDRFVWRFKLKHELFDQITAKMERLRFEIEATKLLRIGSK